MSKYETKEQATARKKRWREMKLRGLLPPRDDLVITPWEMDEHGNLSRMVYAKVKERQNECPGPEGNDAGADHPRTET